MELLKECIADLNEGKVKFTMCPFCNEQNDIKKFSDKHPNQYLCDNCKKGYKSSYIGKDGKLKK